MVFLIPIGSRIACVRKRRFDATRHEHEVTADDLGGSIMGAKIRAEGARKRAAEAIREADRAEAEAWSVQMEGYGGPAQRPAQCINGGLGWLEVECKRCKTRASLPLDAIRRPRSMPIWKLDAALDASWIGARKRTKRKQAQAGSCKWNPRLVSPLRTSKLPTWRRNDFALLVGRSQLGTRPCSTYSSHRRITILSSEN